MYKIWFESQNAYFCTPKNTDNSVVRLVAHPDFQSGGSWVESFDNNDSVAQLVEQYTFNVWVLGPSPSGITNRLLKQAVFLCLIPIFCILQSSTSIM